jgi:hypothetical protein
MVFNIQSRESAYQLSQTLDNIGNYTLIAATVVGLISIDMVLLAAICQKASEPRDENHRHRDREDLELFWLTRIYFRSWDHHCCHDYHHHHRRRRLDDDLFSYEIFAALTMFISLVCTAIAITLAIHFNLPGMVLFLSGIWLTAFALKAMAYAIRPDMSNAPEFQATSSVSSDKSPSIPVANPVLRFDPNAIYTRASVIDEQSTPQPSAPPYPYQTAYHSR